MVAAESWAGNQRVANHLVGFRQQLGVLAIDSLREKHLGGEGQVPAAKKYMTFTKMHFSTHNPGSVQRMIYSFRFWYVSQA